MVRQILTPEERAERRRQQIAAYRAKLAGAVGQLPEQNAHKRPRTKMGWPVHPAPAAPAPVDFDTTPEEATLQNAWKGVEAFAAAHKVCDTKPDCTNYHLLNCFELDQDPELKARNVKLCAQLTVKPNEAFNQQLIFERCVPGEEAVKRGTIACIHTAVNADLAKAKGYDKVITGDTENMKAMREAGFQATKSSEHQDNLKKMLLSPSDAFWALNSRAALMAESGVMNQINQSNTAVLESGFDPLFMNQFFHTQLITAIWNVTPDLGEKYLLSALDAAKHEANNSTWWNSIGYEVMRDRYGKSHATADIVNTYFGRPQENNTEFEKHNQSLVQHAPNPVVPNHVAPPPPRPPRPPPPPKPKPTWEEQVARFDASTKSKTWLSLGCNTVAPVTSLSVFPTQIDQVERLYISGQTLQSLQDLPELPALKSLNATDDQLVRLGIKFPVPYLTEIRVPHNHLTNPAGFPQDAPKLRKIILDHNPITSFRGFPASVHHLTELSVVDSKLKNLKSLPKDLTVKELDVSSNPGLTFAKTPETLFTRLTKLQASNLPGIVIPTHLMLNLTDLIATRSELTEAPDLYWTPGIKTIDLQWNNLTSFEGFPRDLEALVRLNLIHNKLTSLFGMPYLPNVTGIDLTDNQLTSLDGLTALPPDHPFPTLYLSGNPITTLRGVSRGNFMSLIYRSDFSRVEKLPSGIKSEITACRNALNNQFKHARENHKQFTIAKHELKELPTCEKAYNVATK
jgi:hypothetical protein